MKLGWVVSPLTLGLVTGLALGWWVYPHLVFESVEQPLDFSHRLHVGEDVGMECLDCHGFEGARTIRVPTTDRCVFCHEEALTDSPDEIRLVEDYIAREREVEWLVYSRQPAGVRFAHAQHTELAELECSACHGAHAETETLPPLLRNRISTYSRALWGRGGLGPGDDHPRGLEMSDCDRCHRERDVEQSCLDCHR